MKRIIVFIIPLLVVIIAFSPSVNKIITGHITDESGNPIASATVVSMGSIEATASDATGFYSIEVSNKTTSLVFTSVAHTSIVIEIKGRSVINATMKASKNSLQEVVITALGIQHREKRKVYSQRASPGNISRRFKKKDFFNTEDYDYLQENGFHTVTDEPLSTFSIDVDAASYSNVRRFLKEGELPPAGAVRIEEMINYFKYDYPQPGAEHPFSITTEMSGCPWNTKNQLLMIGLQGKNFPVENLPASNLVFLIDVSGSMNADNKLPLVKSSLKLLTEKLRAQDKISIVVYAGSAGLVLPATSGSDKIKIKAAIEELEAGGSTAGGEGIRLAYKTAKEHFLSQGNNRVLLCTDGDFNVGASSNDELVSIIEKERESGVYLTVLGYGIGNYKDNKMQQLAGKGNGNHAYIDGMNEARKVLINEFSGTLFTIAKDVKLQVEFNPAKIAGYRLIGYENRMLNKEDFNDDKKDAGELGSGHTVTALYEIIPAGITSPFLKTVDPLKYQRNKKAAPSTNSSELLTVKFRYKEPARGGSKLMVKAVDDNGKEFSKTSSNFRFAAAVAEFGMMLRESEYKGNSSYQAIVNIATNATGDDEEEYRQEFITLVNKAAELVKNKQEDVGSSTKLWLIPYNFPNPCRIFLILQQIFNGSKS